MTILVITRHDRPPWRPSWILKNAQGYTQFTRQIMFMGYLGHQNQSRKKLYQSSHPMLAWLPDYG